MFNNIASLLHYILTFLPKSFQVESKLHSEKFQAELKCQPISVIFFLQILFLVANLDDIYW